jgi:hypothetical protein
VDELYYYAAFMEGKGLTISLGYPIAEAIRDREDDEPEGNKRGNHELFCRSLKKRFVHLMAGGRASEREQAEATCSRTWP